jgi:hypothetical protein
MSTAIGAAAMGLACLLAAAECGAQGLGQFHFGVWSGSLETEALYERDYTRQDPGSTVDFSSLTTVERLLLRNSGFYVVDPKLITGNLSLNFGLLQDGGSVNGESNFSHEKLTGYSLDTTAFSGLPYNGTLFASRSQSFLNAPFGRTDVTFEDRGGSLRLGEDSPLRDVGLPYLSANVRLEEQHIQSHTTSALAQSFHQDDLLDMLTHDGHKGFETADLDWRFQLIDSSSPITPYSNYLSRAGNLNYSLDFGPTSNWRWESRLSSYDRSGISPFAIYTANESLHIDHRSDLSTDYYYQLQRMETAIGPTTTQIGSVRAQDQVYRNLGASASATVERQKLPDGLIESYSGQADLNYRHDLPGKGNLQVRTSSMRRSSA